MKKTLIALATLAVAGTAFAQSSVTISGGVAYGYRSTTTTVDAKDATAGTAAKGYTDYVAAVAAKNAVKDAGFGMDTAAIKITAVEDLGGGLKATGVISAAGLARGNTVAGEDMSLTLSGGFGSIMAGQIEIGSGIRGLAQAGAPVNNMETEVLAPAVNSDIVKYTAPAMNGFTFSGSLTEAVGLGAGLTDAGVSSSRAVTVGVAYANGPVSAAVDTSNWSNSTTSDSRYRVSGSYDLGVAKVGAGYDSTKAPTTGAKTNYTMMGVSMPLGAVTVGAVYAKKDSDATAGDQTGTSFGASYALSKRTSLSVNYSSWEYKEGSSIKNKKTNLLLAHSF